MIKILENSFKKGYLEIHGISAELKLKKKLYLQ